MIQFIDIFQIINQYYPLGIDWDNTFYQQQYPGLIKLNKIRESKFNGILYDKWQEILNKIKKEFSQYPNIFSETLLSDVCYTGIIILEDSVKDDWKYRQSMNFHISLLAPYFTILVKENMFKHMPKTTKAFKPILHISPNENFQDHFVLLRQIIERYYTDYQFLPYSLLNVKVNALYIDVVPETDTKSSYASVFQAFFTSEDINQYVYQGDYTYY